MNIIVIGSGKLGAALADKLSERGDDVAVIDSNEEKFDNLSDDFGGLQYGGVPIDADTLEKAGIRSCDVFIAATSEDDLNIMSAQIAKEVFGVKKVVINIADREKETIYNEMGYITVCATNLAVDSLLSAVDGYSSENYMRVRNHVLKFFEIPVPEDFIGERAIDITLEEGEILYGVITGGVLKLVTNYNFILGEDDILVFSKLVD